MVRASRRALLVGSAAIAAGGAGLLAATLLARPPGPSGCPDGKVACGPNCIDPCPSGYECDPVQGKCVLVVPGIKTLRTPTLSFVHPDPCTESGGSPPCPIDEFFEADYPFDAEGELWGLRNLFGTVNVEIGPVITFSEPSPPPESDVTLTVRTIGTPEFPGRVLWRYTVLKLEAGLDENAAQGIRDVSIGLSANTLPSTGIFLSVEGGVHRDFFGNINRYWDLRIVNANVAAYIYGPL